MAGTKASPGSSALVAVSVPPVVGARSSVTLPLPAEMMAPSKVPVTVTVTVVVLPSFRRTVKSSVSTWPSVSSWAASPSV